MSPPKHLWSGDWERESAAAAEARANAEARAWPQPPEPVPAPRPEHNREPVRRPEPPRRPTPDRRRSAAPPPPRPRARRERPRRRIPLPRPRVVLLSALALLLLAGAAYGLTSLGGRTNLPATGTPWLGARLESWPAGGALVARVVSGGPAASAGLRSGDIIIQVQGRPVTAPYNVTSAIGALSGGDRLQMLVVRGGRTFPTTATLGARPPEAP